MLVGYSLSPFGFRSIAHPDSGRRKLKLASIWNQLLVSKTGMKLRAFNFKNIIFVTIYKLNRVTPGLNLDTADY